LNRQREPKPDWQHLPERLRARITENAGEEIAHAEIAWGGFGPSATFILRLPSGRKLFCKGSHPGQTDVGNTAFAREKLHYEHFPELAQFAPGYHGAVEEAGWHMLVLDCVERTREVPPWDTKSCADTIDLIARFHDATPAHAEEVLPKAEESSAFDLVKHELGWGSLAGDPAARARFLALFGPDAPAWFDKNIARLVSLEAAAPTVGGPRSWLHLDIRSDNLLFAQDRIVLVDWPFLVCGPRLWDIGFFLPSLAGEGGPEPALALADYEKISGIRFAADEVLIVAATIAGFFAARAGEPDIPALPRLRWVQKLQLYPALTWTCALSKTSPPVKLG
jgi:hypothetical protein